MTPADTRTALLDLAEEMLRGRSFNAFSYQDLADGIGIRKASIHYHFPTKEDLGVALVERFRQRGVSWASRLVEQGASPLEKLDAYLQLQADVLDEKGKICAMGILGAEYNALPERMRESYGEFLEEQQGWLSRQIASGQTKGLIAAGTAPEDLAAFLQSSIMGALQIARASGRPERFHAVVRQLRRNLRPQTAAPAEA